LEIITHVREMDPNGDIEAFCYFFDHLVPCSAGRKVWTQREKANKLRQRRWYPNWTKRSPF
jgi:hypothetical protein